MNKDLNKKILEAFTSIIDRGTKLSANKFEPIIEQIPHYNVESGAALNRNTTKSKITLQSESEPIIQRNVPDVFKRNKLSADFLHKNVFLMSKMLSGSGSILSKSSTKLCSKTHRHMSKVIRRARQMGILPYMYRPKVNSLKSTSI